MKNKEEKVGVDMSGDVKGGNPLNDKGSNLHIIK